MSSDRKNPAGRIPPRAGVDHTSIGRVLGRVRRAAAAWTVPSVTLIARSRGSPFDLLVSTVLSLRTRDETTLAAFERLGPRAPDPASVVALGAARIAQLIHPVGFYRTKARQLVALSERLIADFGGVVPADLDALLSLPGVGRKTANLVLTAAFGLPGICVDTHVHRITNRLGFVRTTSPDDTEIALRQRLPRRWWLSINEILVALGQQVCHPTSPKCSICPIATACPRRGVTRSR